MNSTAVGSDHGRPPFFSIVIPTFQRPGGLRNCLTGIAGINTDRATFEVIVVDDHGDSDPAVVVDAFSAILQIRLLKMEKNMGPASARNAGAEAAAGRYLVFIDDDCIPSPEWLNVLGNRIGEQGERAFGGNCQNGLGDSIWSEAQQMLLDYLNRHFNGNADEARFCPTNNLAVPRQAFLDLGGFDTSFRFAAGEDRDFSERWLRSGARMSFITDVPVYHQHAMGFAEFCRLHYRYGRGARRYRTRDGSAPHRDYFEPLSFYAGLIVYPFSRTTWARAQLLALLQVLSQGAHTVGYVREWLSAV